MKRLLFSFAVLAISMPSFAQWSTSGNNTIHTNPGNVGIGSTNPQTTLEVNGDTFSKSFRVLSIGDNINGAPWYGIGLSNTGLGGGPAANVIQLGGFAGLSFKTAGGQMIMNTDGNLGIGTGNPQGKLHIEVPLDGSLSALTIGNGHSTGNLNVPFGASTGGYNIDFKTWRDIVPDQIGARIRSERINLFAPNSALIQGADLSFYTSDGGEQSRLAERLRIKYNGFIGIGTEQPISKFHVKLTDEFAIIQRPSNSNYAGHFYVTGPDNAVTYGFFTGLRENSNNYQIFNGQRNENALTIRQDNSFVGIGTNNPDALLAVKGKIHAQEVLIDVNLVPDYVFEKKYKLRSLKELDNYITKNKHLPEVSPAHLMEKEGVNVSTMNMTLLKKVEELTLYLIAKDKQLNKQQKQISDQQRQIRVINAKLGKISAAHK